MDDENLPALSLDKTKKSMNAINSEGMSYSMMLGIGDAYISAAAVALGASNFYIGLLAAAPQLLGAAMQSISLSVLRLIKNRKSMVVAGVLFHSLCWLPIIAMLLWPSTFSMPVILIFFTLGAASSLLVNPAWSSLVSDIVNSNQRAGFFAHRNQLMQIVLFVATFGTGFLLDMVKAQYEARLAFAFVFFLAFLSRLISAYQNSKIADVPYECLQMNEIKLKHLFLLPAYKKELWFLVFIALLNFTTQFASPFFTPYMLNNLHYDLALLGVMTAISILAKIVSFPYWGKVIDRYSNRTVLFVTAFMVPVVPLLWLFGDNIWLIGVAQVFSGFIWAGCDLAVSNSVLSMVGRELRPSFIAKYNSFAAFSNAIGAIAGALFLANFGNVIMFGFSGILLVFLISGIGRFLVAFIFTSKLWTKKEIHNTSEERAMILQLVAVYPTRGAMHQVMNGWNFTRKIIETGAKKSEKAIISGIETTEEIVFDEGKKIISKLSKKKRL